MLSDLLWCSVLITFALYGLANPFVALCGVIWVDILKPQNLSFSFLAGKPLSLIVTIVFFISLISHPKDIRVPDRVFPSVVLAFFMIWITLATYNAQFQTAAWWKYDYVIKALIFPFFIPFVLNTRVKIEMFVATLVTALGYFLMIGGLRTLLGGGAYGEHLVYSADGDGGITESSTLSMVAVLSLPFIHYMYKTSIFKTESSSIKLLMFLFVFFALLTTVGTYARTGLVGLFVLFFLLFIQSKSKFKLGVVVFILIVLIVPFLPAKWTSRMNTIGNAEKDASAFGRVVVWRWTLDYVSERPILGGGFSSYRANAGELHQYIDSGEQNIRERSNGKDFHNAFFQVLGELGYGGLFLYLTLIYMCFTLNRKTMRYSGIGWKNDLAKSTNMSLLVFCTCGMFIGVAYTPWVFYFLGIATSLHNVKD